MTKKATAAVVFACTYATVAGCGAILGPPAGAGPDAGDGAAPSANEAGRDDSSSSSGEGGDGAPEAGDGALDAPGLDASAPDAAEAAPFPGALDPSFGTAGLFILPLNLTAPAQLEQVAIRSDGYILYSGFASCDGGRFAFIGRLSPDGKPDTSFNPEGNAGYTAGCSAAAGGGLLWLSAAGPKGGEPSGPTLLDAWVAALAGDKIAVAGTALLGSGPNTVMFASQYTSSGALETSFGDAGYAFFTSGAVPATTSDFLVFDGGAYFVAGSIANAPALASVASSTGAPNPLFTHPISGDDGGIGATTFGSGDGVGITAIAALPGTTDILAAVAGAGTELGIAVDTTTGMPATSLSGGAFNAASSTFVSSNPDGGATSCVAVLSDNSFAFVGNLTDGDYPEFAVFSSDGQPDPAFGSGGVSAPIAFSYYLARALGTRDGKLFASTTGPNPPFVYRIESDGGWDKSFLNSNATAKGYWQLPVVVPNDCPAAGAMPLALDAENRVLAGAVVYVTNCAPEVAIARFFP